MGETVSCCHVFNSAGEDIAGEWVGEKDKTDKANKISYCPKGPEICPQIDFISTSQRKKLHKENTGSWTWHNPTWPLQDLVSTGRGDTGDT